jgi:hypothetical protein
LKHLVLKYLHYRTAEAEHAYQSVCACSPAAHLPPLWYGNFVGRL